MAWNKSTITREQAGADKKRKGMESIPVMIAVEHKEVEGVEDGKDNSEEDGGDGGNEEGDNIGESNVEGAAKKSGKSNHGKRVTTNTINVKKDIAKKAWQEEGYSAVRRHADSFLIRPSDRTLISSIKDPVVVAILGTR
ncbi:hypothetical protein Syun_025629 [Stephania yunnanensis]|uniref:Uncharacterized protein n=1 Tax=Stephania yunnanensis TaxID=152371 RepID=A0AAP0ESH8_9MAGN